MVFRRKTWLRAENVVLLHRLWGKCVIQQCCFDALFHLETLLFTQYIHNNDESV